MPLQEMKQRLAILLNLITPLEKAIYPEQEMWPK